MTASSEVAATTVDKTGASDGPRVQQEPACRWAHGAVAELDHRGLCPVCAEDEEEL